MVGLQIMKKFSVRHRLHNFVLVEYVFAWVIIFHVIVWLMPLSFSFQMYLLNAVALRSPMLLKLCLWFVNLFLNVPSVSPMYVDSSSLSALFTVAWYINDFDRHFPSKGHACRRQLQSLLVLLLALLLLGFWVFLNILLLCDDTICCMFAIQL